jgi:hypothetical protein
MREIPCELRFYSLKINRLSISRARDFHLKNDRFFGGLARLQVESRDKNHAFFIGID